MSNHFYEGVELHQNKIVFDSTLAWGKEQIWNQTIQ